LGLIITAVLAVIMAWFIPSVIKLWYIIGSLTIPPILLPVVSAYFNRFMLSPKATQWVMGISFVISILAFSRGILNIKNGQFQYLWGMEPFFPGLLFSMSYYIICNTVKYFILYGKQK
jgi:hypothetical protein